MYSRVDRIARFMKRYQLLFDFENPKPRGDQIDLQYLAASVERQKNSSHTESLCGRLFVTC